MKMKKITALLIAAALLVGVSACGDKPNTDNPSDVTTSGDASDVTTSGDSSDDTTAGTKSDVPSDPIEFLGKVWDSYSDDDKFPAAGGLGDGNIVDSAPGKMELDGETLNWKFSFPTDSVDKLDAVASLTHMLNENTFSSAAFHLKDAADAEAIAQALRDGIQARRWMCGFPDKLIVVTVDSTVVAAFGLEDLINTFRDKLVSVYPDASINFDEPIQA